MEAFESNVPEYFLREEIPLYSSFLDRIEGMLHDINRSSFYFVIEIDKKILACGGFGDKDNNNRITLAWGLVHKNYHKTGLGELLLKFRFQKLKEKFPGLPVWIDTTQHAAGFFEKFGFKTTKFTPDFYAPGMHRYDMVKNFE